MKHFYLLLLLSVFISNCFAQKSDCNKFKTGTFEYIDNNNNKQTVIRNDTTQIEFNKKNDIKIITTVNWISDCEYTLIYKDIENYPKKNEVIGEKISVKIIETNDNTYTIQAISDAINSKITFTKIN